MTTRKFELVSSAPDSAKLPIRSTKTAAGYDFFAASDIIIPTLASKQERHLDNEKTKLATLVMTGVKAIFPEDEYLQLSNRSSGAYKRNLVLANGIGIIDSDYYNNSSNEGEIGFLFYNVGTEIQIIKRGDKIGQGIFQKYLLVDDDNINESLSTREGGFGSTGK